MSEGSTPAEPVEKPVYERTYLRRILDETKTIAAVGVSAKSGRPSYMVMRYLQQRGFEVIPVNPAYEGQTLLGETVYARLADIPRDRDPIQMVNIFRKSEAAGAVVDEALEALLDRGLETIWMQIGVIDRRAARRAEAAGLRVVMSHCPKMEHGRIFGELGAFGVNTGVMTSRRRLCRRQGNALVGGDVQGNTGHVGDKIQLVLLGRGKGVEHEAQPRRRRPRDDAQGVSKGPVGRGPGRLPQYFFHGLALGGGGLQGQVKHHTGRHGAVGRRRRRRRGFKGGRRPPPTTGQGGFAPPPRPCHQPLRQRGGGDLR